MTWYLRFWPSGLQARSIRKAPGSASVARDIDAKPPLDGNVVDGAIGKNRTTLKRVLRFAMAIIRLNWVRET